MILPLVSTVCGVALSAAALALAAPAAADPSDDAFIAGLSRGGISMPDNENAIATAHNVCGSVDTNPNVSMLAIQLTKQTNLTLKQSGYFIGLSVATYCPQFKDKVDPSLAWLIPPPVM